MASEYGLQTEDPAVENVVFIVHGIRDYGYWSQKIGREILRRATGTNTVILSPSYGYFPILPFLLPGVRQEKVEWLLDKYVEVRRQYPNAKMSYVGHSNGTYLFARAMELCPMLKFHRAVFAGSVVKCSFPWRNFLTRQVDSVINFVATSDWVVASVPRSVQPFGRVFDLGSAGHDGFSMSGAEKSLMNVRYVKGGHSAGISEMLWDDIAEFVLNGSMPTRKPHLAFPQKRLYFEQFLGATSAPLFIAAVLLVLGLGWSLLAAIFGFNAPPAVGEFAAWKFISAHPNYAWISLLLYVYLLRVILTKF
jgi:hypothetical protein